MAVSIGLIDPAHAGPELHRRDRRREDSRAGHEEDNQGLTIDLTSPAELQTLIDRGLRARLSLTGITGLLFVELKFEDARNYPANPRFMVDQYPVVPAIPSPISEAQQSIVEIVANLKKVDFAGLSKDLKTLLTTTNKKVGVLYPNDADGNAIRANLAPALEKAGFTIVDAGPYEDGTTDYSAQIAKFKAEKCEIFNTFPIPPDFAAFWRQAAQQGFTKTVKIAQGAQALNSIWRVGASFICTAPATVSWIEPRLMGPTGARARMSRRGCVKTP